MYYPNHNLSIRSIILVFLLFFQPSATVANQRFFPHSYAVVIGIDQYDSSSIWPTIPYGKKDASAMAERLREAEYEVVELLGKEATRENILTSISEDIAPRLTGHDRVLVYFSGHGETREVGWRDFGYIIPYDGTSRFPTWISMAEIRELSEHMLKARHQLFIFDSCYGGSVGIKAGRKQIGHHPPGYIETISANRARHFLTAGGKNEQVLATGPNNHSYFTGHLLQALDGEADRDQDTYVTMSELSAFLLSAASTWEQTPRWGVMPEHAQGEFWFRVPGYEYHRMPDVSSLEWATPPRIFKNDAPDGQSGPPLLLSHPQGPIDNFVVIDGIDVDVQAELYALGIFHYWQIADWTEKDLDWLRKRTFVIGQIADRSWISAAESLDE